MDDRDVIDAFVAYLRNSGFPDLQVDQRPDEANRSSPEIDAIAGEFAIEHTSIDTLPNQRRNTVWFEHVAAKLKSEIADPPRFRLRIALDETAIVKGQDWVAIGAALARWVSDSAPQLSDGHQFIESSSLIPFRFHVSKASNRPPGVSIGPFAPHDDTLASRLRHQFDKKITKLAPHREKQKTTILLIESDDLSLMDASKLVRAIVNAYPDAHPPGVDQMWYVETSLPEHLEFQDLSAELSDERRSTSASSSPA